MGLRKAARRARSALLRRTTPRWRRPLNGALPGVIAYNQHGGYVIPTGAIGRPAAQAILAGKAWEPDTIRRILACARKGGDIVHAGAFFGDALPALAAGLSPGAMLWAFEPVTANHACAAMTVILNGLGDTVRLVNAALGPAHGSVEIVTHDLAGRALGGRSHVTRSCAPHGRSEMANQVAVDAIVGRHVAVIHLDVEHFEQQALAGALQTIRRCRPVLILENVPAEPWFAENILSLGYKAAGTVDVNSVFTAERQAPPCS
jgi:FkbM family methyltransferase